MAKTEIDFLNACKSLIEEKLDWPPSENWRQRDFLNLINLIENESGISISLSTIRRLWKVDYSGTPQPSTLNALAKFLAYEDWLDFKSKYKKAQNAISELDIPNNKKSLSSFLPFFIAAIVLILLALVFQQFSSFPSEQRATLSVENATPINVPNTVIFTYHMEGIDADSFFIQQSWNQLNRERVSEADSIFTSTYYYPGAHHAKLIANDKIIAETTLKIKTEAWIAASRLGFMDNLPIYLDTKKEATNGILSISEAQLKQSRPELDPALQLSYYYVNDFVGLDKNNFKLKLRLKNDSLLNIPCPIMSVLVLGTKDMHLVPLTSPGCIGNINMKLGDQVIEGKNTNLSAFGTNVYDWQLVELSRRDQNFEVRLNEEPVYNLSADGDIGQIIGINVNFAGSGAIDFVELKDTRTDAIIYKEVF